MYSVPGPVQAERNNQEAAAAEAARQKTQAEQTRQTMGNYISNPGGGLVVYGTDEVQSNVAADLSQVGAMTGQNLFQAGQQQQDYFNSLQERRNGTDKASAFLKGQGNRNMAEVGRQIKGRGIAGGVGAASMMQGRQMADAQVADKMQGWNASNDKELWNYVKRNQKVTGEAIAQGTDKGIASGIDTSGAEGAFGTVICSELYRQGLMSHEIFLKDMTFGMKLEIRDPHALYGYQMLAAPVVKLMKKSKVFTRIIAVPALAWAESMAGKRNLAGATIMFIGIPLCRFTHKVFSFLTSTSGERNVI